MAVRKNVRFCRKLGQRVRGASLQFDAGNPAHDKLNVLGVREPSPPSREFPRRTENRSLCWARRCRVKSAGRRARWICSCGSTLTPDLASISRRRMQTFARPLSGCSTCPSETMPAFHLVRTRRINRPLSRCGHRPSDQESPRGWRDRVARGPCRRDINGAKPCLIGVR
jgi:hypothetical protein